MRMLLAVMALVVAGMWMSVHATPQDTSKETCEGRARLYIPAILSFSLFDAKGGFSIQKEDPHPVSFVSSGDECLGPIPVYRVNYLENPEPASDTHQMAKRLAPFMASHSQETGMEVCARMCSTPSGGIVAQLVTVKAHIVCAAPKDTCPAGSVATAETIHSHPPQRVFHANSIDAIGWEDKDIEGKLTHTGDPDTMSPEDRSQAPVWMVAPNAKLVFLSTPDGEEIERP